MSTTQLIAANAAPRPVTPRLRVLRGQACFARIAAWSTMASTSPIVTDPRWLRVLSEGFGHEAYAVESLLDDEVQGYLPLLHVRSLLFGNHLVSLPYINTAGVVAESDNVSLGLIDRAHQLADELRVRHLQLRHETAIDHPALAQTISSKVHMRLPLPATNDALWTALSPKVRNQIRKAQKHNFTITWGRQELLAPFYRVFSHNMRDLGTPVYARRLFERLLTHFADEAELCVLRHAGQPIACALMLHGAGRSEVLSASTLRQFNSLCPNMQMYWELLVRSITRHQPLFDFGRSTIDSNTYRFKRQWGAEPHPATWQFYTRVGGAADLRPDNPKFALATRLWQKLPLWLANTLGPTIVRGIP